MGRMYIATIDIASATTQRDILEVAVGDNRSIVVHEILITTDVEGDANEEAIELELARYTGSYTSGTTGLSTPSGIALDERGAADGATVTTGATTQAVVGTGAKAVLANIWMNNRAGLHYLPPPESRINVSHNGTDNSGLVVAMQAAAAAALAWGGYVVYEELG